MPAPSAQYRVNVKLGTAEFPADAAKDPSAFALKVRRQLTDEQRSLRIFGSEVVIGRLTRLDPQGRVAFLLGRKAEAIQNPPRAGGPGGNLTSKATTRKSDRSP